jgi:hypothetical protein
MNGFKYESQDRRCNFVLEEKLADWKGRTLNFKNNFDLLIVSNPKIKSMAFEELKENTENIQEQAKRI